VVILVRVAAGIPALVSRELLNAWPTESAKAKAVRRMKRQPLRTVGIALGVGLVLGVAVGRIGCRPGRQ
jgi:hypothetical protein